MEAKEIKELIATLRNTQSNAYTGLCESFMRNILAQRIEDDIQSYIDNSIYNDAEDILEELSHEFKLNL